MLEWLIEGDVMNAIGFYAGGAATAIGGLWVAYNKIWLSKPAENPNKPKSLPSASANASHGIASGRDVTVNGNITISQTPKAAWAVLGAGLICLSVVVLFGGDNTTVTNGALVEGDMTNSSISTGE